MNPIATGLGVADLEETIAGRPEGYVVPKPRHAGDVREIAQHPRRLEHRHGLAHGIDAAGADRHRDAGGAAEHPRGRRGQPAHRHRVVGHRGPVGAAMGLPRVRDAEGRYLDIPRYARVMCTIVASAAGVRGARHRLHRHRRSGRAAARVRGRRGDGLQRQDLHPSLADRGHQRGLHAGPGGRRRGARAGRRLRGAPPARRLRVPLQGPDGGRASPDARAARSSPRRAEPCGPW